MPADKTNQTDNLVALLRLVEAGFNSDNLDQLDDVIAPDVVLHVSFPTANGRDAFKALLRMIRDAFPDVLVRIDDISVQGETIYRRWSASGSHTGEFPGIPPTGRTISLAGVDIDRFEAGQVVEHWSFWDRQTLVEQLAGD